jgi:hypothetical protein
MISYDMPRTPSGRRGRTPLPESERKDRLIQTRVDEDLDETLRREAKKKRVTVSQLIRNVLQDAFHLVDDIVVGAATLTETVRQDARRIADSAKGREPAKRAPGFGMVATWQEVVLGRDVDCARCAAALPHGTRALFGVAKGPAGTKLWLCGKCRDALQLW